MVRRPGTVRGFTLVELLVAGACSLLAVVAAGAVMGRLAIVHRRDTARSQMRREAQLALSRLSWDLRHAGLGVPSAGKASGTHESFPPPVFHVDAHELRFIADLPRPDSTVNGFSWLSGSQPVYGSPGFFGVALINELNGDCDVDTSSPPHCDTETESLLLATPAAPAGGCGGSAAAPTCPWALGKYRDRPQESVIVANGMGVWDEFHVAGGVSAVNGTQRALALDDSPSFLDARTPNRGFVSTPDRVFYRLHASDGTVERAQCWGPLGMTPRSTPPAPAAPTAPAGRCWRPRSRASSWTSPTQRAMRSWACRSTWGQPGQRAGSTRCWS